MTQQEDQLEMHSPFQEVNEDIDEQQLKGVQGAGLPINLDTGRPVRPVIVHPTGRMEATARPPFVMPIDFNTGRPVMPIVTGPVVTSHPTVSAALDLAARR
jgi:hypothetical protein